MPANLIYILMWSWSSELSYFYLLYLKWLRSLTCKKYAFFRTLWTTKLSPRKSFGNTICFSFEVFTILRLPLMPNIRKDSCLILSRIFSKIFRNRTQYLLWEKLSGMSLWRRMRQLLHGYFNLLSLHSTNCVFCCLYFSCFNCDLV